jgi:cysteine-rich repeat protein
MTCVALVATTTGGCGLILDPRARDAGRDAPSIDAFSIDVGETDVGDVGALDAHASDVGPRDGSVPELGEGCRCGDGLVGGDEECDDANVAEGDGCTDCLVEDGWDCDEPEPPWVFPLPTGLGPMGVPSFDWMWATDPMGSFVLTYSVDEERCIIDMGSTVGYAVRELETGTDYTRCQQWISVGPSGCEAIGPSGFRWFRAQFVVPSAGVITLGLGWDNWLQAVRLDGEALLVRPNPAPAMIDGWPAPQGFVDIDTTPGTHVLELVVQEVGPGAVGTNQTAISVAQVQPSVCVRR